MITQGAAWPWASETGLGHNAGGMHVLNSNAAAQAGRNVFGLPWGPRSSNENLHHRESESKRHSTALHTLCDGIFQARGAALATAIHVPPDDERVVINVSGEEYETCYGTLGKFPHSLLGDPVKRSSYWDSERKQFFIDRHRPTFPAVMSFYQTGGKLHKPVEVPDDIFCEELEFYELGKDVIDNFKWKMGVIPEEKIIIPEHRIQKLVFNLFEEPTSSKPARVLAIFSVLMIVISIAAFCTETMPVYQSTRCLDKYKEQLIELNITETEEELASHNFMDGVNFSDPFFCIETVCVVWFTIEFIFRFIASPLKLEFMKNVMNLFDLAAIVPYYIQLIIMLAQEPCLENKGNGLLQILRVMRLLRVIRVFKLSKHSKGLQILGYTFQRSFKELSLFVITLMITALIFSSCMYFAELRMESSHFGSIPETLWWSVVTMTTVGYGDYYPQGFAGKLVGALCAIAGMIALAIPMPVIVTNFNNIYIHNRPKGGL